MLYSNILYYTFITLYPHTLIYIVFITHCSIPGFLVLHYLLEFSQTHVHWSIPGSSDGEEFACNAGDLDLIPGSERSLGEGNGNPLQYSCLENTMDRRTQQATVHRVSKSQTDGSNLTQHSTDAFIWKYFNSPTFIISFLEFKSRQSRKWTTSVMELLKIRKCYFQFSSVA